LTLAGAVVDLSGALRGASREIDLMIDAGDALRLWAGRLQGVSAQGAAVFRQAIVDLGDAALAGLAQAVRHCVFYDSEGRGHLAKLSLLQQADATEASAPLLWLTITRLDEPAPLTGKAAADDLFRDLGLSAGEAKVAQALVLGRSVRQMAEDRSMPIAAVRRELIVLYHKIGGYGLTRPPRPLKARFG